MLLGLLRFEWRYHARRVTFWVAAAAMALIGGFFISTGYGPANLNVNSPYVVMQSLGVLSLLSGFVMTVFCVPAALRDVEHGMMGMVYATPVGKLRYLLSRFAGALLPGAAVMGLTALVLLLAPLVLPVESARVGLVQPVAYLWALLVLVLPNVLLVAAVLFAVATLTRSSLATYVGAVVIYALYLVTALLTDSPLMAGTAPPTPEALARAALLDPFGLSAFFEQTRYWTPTERNTRLLALTGRVLLNRALWGSVAVGVLALVYGLFSFELLADRPPASAAADPAAMPTRPYHPVAPAGYGGRAWWYALGWATRLELGHVLRGWPLRVLLIMWVFVAGMECTAQVSAGEYGTRLLPTTGLMLGALQLPLLLLGTIMVVYFAAEVVWRERLLGIAPLLDATPAGNAVFFLAKLLTLGALPLLLTLTGMAVGAAVQLVSGGARVEVGLYLTLLGWAALPLLLFAVGALALQVVSPNRWLGMMAGLLLAFVAYRGSVLGLAHPMLHFGTGPAAPYSDMDGFGPVVPSFVAFMLYWAVLAAVLAYLGLGLWQRGPEASLLSRLRSLPRHWGPGGQRVFLAGVGLLLLVGGALYEQITRVHPWESPAEQQAWRADYERRYRRYARRPQPSVVAVRTQVELFPAARRARISGTYVLENRTGQPLDTVCVVVPRTVSRAAIRLPSARLLRYDARFGVYLFRLPQPLLPGQQRPMHFRVALDRRGIRADGFGYDVTRNGTFLTSYDAFPLLGYRPGYELSDAGGRRRYGLPAAPTKLAPLPCKGAGRAAAPVTEPARAWLTLDATVSTSREQTALCPGQLVSRWTRGPRRYFRYQFQHPVTPNFGFLSARYAVRRVQHGPVAVEVWYHPTHAANVPRILAAATRSLAVLGGRYGAYPHRVLRIAEVPAWSDFGAYAMPGMVFFAENRGFTADARPNEVDLLTRRVAHEVAHQWWGHTLDPARCAGASMLVETLAKHSEQLVVAAVHGEAALPPMLAFDEDRYLAGRTGEEATEPAMLAVDEQAYLYYGKGAVMMNSLRDLLGPAAVDRALRRLLAAYGGPHGAATARDLYGLLRTEAVTAPQRALLEEWFTRRVVYDLRVDTARVVSTAHGRSRITVGIRARKLLSPGRAGGAPRLEGEALDVQVLNGPPGVGRVVYAGKQRVHNGRIFLRLELPQPPQYVVVDPYIRRIDLDRSNNQKRFSPEP